MLDPATARLCVWRLPLEAAFRLFSKLGSLGGSIRERFSRTGRTRPALARPAFSRWLLENDRLRERWPCQWLNVLYFPFSETSPCWQDPWGSRSRGQCAVGTHFKGFGVLGLQGTEPALCSLAWLSGDRWAHVASVAKAAPCALRPLIT